MRVLVTGAAGSIGSVVCSGLMDRGHTVVGLDLTAEPGGSRASGPPPTARTRTPSSCDSHVDRPRTVSGCGRKLPIRVDTASMP